MPRNRDDHSDPYMNGRNGYDPEDRKRKSGMNLKKIFAVSFCIVIGVVLISGGVVYKLGHDLYSQINYVADEDVKTVETLPEEAFEETLSSEERTGVAVSADELSSIQDKMNSIAIDTKEAADVYNVLLVGVDRQERNWNGNSDSMILVSINKTLNKVTMTSLMRDTYVYIPDVGYKKLNYAYAVGAGPLLCQVVTDTYKLKVDRYAAVDFWDLVEIIDIVGGIDLEITAKEAEVANGYIMDMCERQLEIDPTSHYLPAEGGTIHCDGVQAVAYARNRYVGNSDFQRTERQRYVIQQLMAEVKRMSVAQMTEKMQAVLQYVTMNIPETEIWSMLAEVPDILNYEFEMTRVPYDDMYEVIYDQGQDMLVPDWEPTLAKMHEAIYGTETAAE